MPLYSIKKGHVFRVYEKHDPFYISDFQSD